MFESNPNLFGVDLDFTSPSSLGIGMEKKEYSGFEFKFKKDKNRSDPPYYPV